MGSYGWLPQKPDPRDHPFRESDAATRLPKTFDLWPNVPPIWDQGQLGSCTAHGALRGYLTEALRQGEQVPMLSRLMAYYDARAIEGSADYDAGAEVRDAIKVLAQPGVCPESEWPYDINRFAEKPSDQCYQDARRYVSIKYQALTVGAPGAPIRSALVKGLPVVFGFSVPDYFEDGTWDPTSDVLRLPGANTQFVAGHCVALTGYDFSLLRHPVPYFIADNSWSPQWGAAWGGKNCTGGRFALDYRWFDPQRGAASDLWVIQAVN